jgi:hypothetical protein
LFVITHPKLTRGHRCTFNVGAPNMPIWPDFKNNTTNQGSGENEEDDARNVEHEGDVNEEDEGNTLVGTL